MKLTSAELRGRDAWRTDRGFSLIELLIIIVIVGLLATIVVFTVTGAKADAENSACPADWRNLNTAAETYFVQFRVTTIPAANATLDGYEQTLVNAGVLRQVSEWYDLDTDGQFVQVAGSPCTV